MSGWLIPLLHNTPVASRPAYTTPVSRRMPVQITTVNFINDPYNDKKLEYLRSRAYSIRYDIKRTLSTHVGSFPRSDELLRFFQTREAGETDEEAGFQQAVESATAPVAKQKPPPVSVSPATVSRAECRS